MFEEPKLKINEIFYSLQGEGKRSGEATIFIRLAGCNLNCSFCDTTYNEYKEMTVEEILKEILRYGHDYIVWTGGEPMLQLTKGIIDYFKGRGFRQGIETNGTKILSEVQGIDHITVSPKRKEFKIEQFDSYLAIEGLVDMDVPLLVDSRGFGHIEVRVPVDNEVQVPRWEGDLQNVSLYLSPIFNSKTNKIIKAHVNRCVLLCKTLPEWKLSLQIHKILNIP